MRRLRKSCTTDSCRISRLEAGRTEAMKCSAGSIWTTGTVAARLRTTQDGLTFPQPLHAHATNAAEKITAESIMYHATRM